MGKCFLLQVRRGLSSLAIATLIPHDDDPPEATSAIEAHRYRVQPFAAEIYARLKVVASYVRYGYWELQPGSRKILQGMLKKYEVLLEAKSQVIKMATFLTTC